MEVIFRPPTLAAPAPSTPTPTAPPTALPLRASPTPVCTNNLVFVKDLTVPDGSQITPKAPIDKRWLVKNTGTCNWDDRYHLRLTSGKELGAVPEQALFPARSGTQATFRIQFTAPELPGTYRSGWQAFAPDDQPFGDPIFIEIVVATPGQ